MQNASSNNQPSAGYFKALTVLFLALLIGQLLFAVIFFVVLKTGTIQPMPPNEQSIFTGAASLVLFVCLVANWQLYKKRIGLIQQETNLNAQLNAYRALYITRFALAEAPVLFAVIILFVGGAQLIWLIVLLGFISFVTLKPSKERLVKELDLSTNDIEKIDEL